MESLYLWGRSIQEMGGDVAIGRSIYGVVVIDGHYAPDSMVCSVDNVLKNLKLYMFSFVQSF